MAVQPSDFTTPVELGSIQSADRTLVRFLPVLVLMGVGVLVLTLLVLGLLMPGVPAVYYPVSVALAVAVPTLMYMQKRRQLNDEYRLNKTLRLSPEGLRRTDGTTVVEISWPGVTRFQEEPVSFAANSKGPIVFPVTGVANAAKRAVHSTTALGLLGVGTVAPRPGATQRSLQLHDERNGSRLQFGDVHNTDRALIFLSEFESDWRNGVIGSWLRHYRPDIRTLG
jgi:hypothetical protein